MEKQPCRLVSGRVGEIDVLAIPRNAEMEPVSLAFEMKSVEAIYHCKINHWIKQASDYVLAEPINGWPPVGISFLWMVGIPLGFPGDSDSTLREEEITVRSALTLAAQFRVGSAITRPKDGLVLKIAGDELFRERREGWTARAQTLLFAKRQAAGVRRRLFA